jgi:two-component system, sensor histidine kinase and response regulator
MTTILVIDDTDALREEIVEVLECEGFEVLSASNGNQGIQLAQEKLPDLIVCDVIMPFLDGYGTLAALRQNQSTEAIPFIFLTAKTTKDDIRHGMTLGADDYLTKPFTTKELLTAIATRLQKQATINKKVEIELDTLRKSISQSLPHELRTPLNGILGFSELLVDFLGGEDQVQLKAMAENIHLSAKQLLRTIQNYLLYAELEISASTPAQPILLDTQKFAYNDMLSELLTQKAQQNDRAPDLHLDFRDSVTVSIPANHLYKIAEEIIDNSFRYSRTGTPIHVSSNISEQDKTFTIQFTDCGRGMTLEQINSIGAYMQFARRLHEQQGAGLGLTIARRLAELYGGTIKIDSIFGKQTTVKLVLPI